MQKQFCRFIAIVYCVVLQACATSKTTQLEHQNYTIDKSQAIDSAVYKMLTVYRDSVFATTNAVIGFSTTGLTKKQPESGLGNFITDAFKWYAQKSYNIDIDAAFVNAGGIRSYLPKGDISLGKIYELMPFDNQIVIQKLKGNILQELLNKAAEKGGWPVSAGLIYGIKDGKAVEITINNKPINFEATYTIANSDYIANGGDNCTMLKGIAMLNNNILMRDAIIEYIKLKTSQGSPINSVTENRVFYAK
jgi:2',3'-cyclic-nucleotide 2'-phosphodiesterase (5'-nucleotidase family)